MITFVIGILITIAPMLKINNLPTYNGSVVVSGVVCDYVDREEYKRNKECDDTNM